MKRILVVGSSCSGKSTFARQLGAKTRLAVYHLDTLFWKPGWVQPDPHEWNEKVKKLIAKEEWIIDGNYRKSLAMRMHRADTVIILDVALWKCFMRVFYRFVMYRMHPRPDMAPGCPERIDLSLLKLIWTYRKLREPVILDCIRKYQEGRTVVVRISSEQEKRSFLNSL